MYTEYKPSILLSQYIETYWFSNSIIEGEKTIKILPDGCVDIIINLGTCQHKNGIDINRPYIVGTMTNFIEVTYSNSINMLGIRFCPGGITALTRTPINEFTNLSINLLDTDTLFDHQFCDEIINLTSTDCRITFINKFLLNKLPYIYQPNKQVDVAINLIKYNKGLLSMKQLASDVCLSQRQFERRFKQAIGISPKEFSRITKFKNTLQYLKKQPYQNLFTTAIECGYYDHAHLIKDFKAFSGNLPSNFI